MSLLTVGPLRRDLPGGPGVAHNAVPSVVDPVRERRQRPPLRLVEPPARPRRRIRVGVVGTGVLAVVLLGIFLLAAVHTLVVQAQFELDRVEQQVEERRGELDGLRLQVAQLESPQAVVRAAVDLGMVNPIDRVYLEPVSSERSIDQILTSPRHLTR